MAETKNDNQTETKTPNSKQMRGEIEDVSKYKAMLKNTNSLLRLEKEEIQLMFEILQYKTEYNKLLNRLKQEQAMMENVPTMKPVDKENEDAKDSNTDDEG